jgi:hypothetical protein
MAEDATGKKPIGVLGQIIIAIAVALTAGGTAPWWLDFLKNRSSPATSPAIVGEVTKRPFTPVAYTGKGISFDPANQQYNVYIYYRPDRQSDAEQVAGGLRAAGYRTDARATSLNEAKVPDPSPGLTVIKPKPTTRAIAPTIEQIAQMAIPVNASRITIFPTDTDLKTGDIQIQMF